MQVFGSGNRTVIWFAVLFAAAMLGGLLVFEVRQWWLVAQVYDDEQFPVPAITPKHIEAMRKLQFVWDARIESGGPVVDPLTPYGSENMTADLGPIIGRRDRVAIARFHREVSEVLIWALENCSLEPGQYALAHLTNAVMERRLRQDLAELTGIPATRIEAIVGELPRLEQDGYFLFTDQHRRLLQHLRFEWPNPQTMWIVARGGYPVPATHFKRPFGDMSAFEIDMAAILDLPRPDPKRLDPVLDRLYWEMWPALQTFVEHVMIDTSTAGGAANGHPSEPAQQAR
jgi:hypothetical protein